MMLNQVLQLVRGHELVAWSRVETLWLVCDCGPHFRSYENAAHFLHTLPLTLKVQVHLLSLGEQHGKGACDRLFGWTNAWLLDYVQKKPVHGLKDCVAALRSGGAQSRNRNPSGPDFLVNVFDPGEVRPSKRKSLLCAELKITRTYSMSSAPSRHSSAGVIIKNNVFSDMKAAASLSQWSITESIATEDVAWRRGYYDKPRSWEEAGPQAGDETQLTKKFAAQKMFKTSSMPRPKRSLEERLSAKARALSKQAAKRRRRRAQHEDASNSLSSSSSSTASSSDSSS